MIHLRHPEVLARPGRVHGHLLAVTRTVEAGRPCADPTQQLHAAEKAIGNGKSELIQDHIDHCLDGAVTQGGHSAKDAMAEIKAITKHL